jgi:hypothetical protein
MIKEIKPTKMFKITIPQELVDYVQRLGRDVDSRVYLIDRMFYNHRNDEDTNMFDSVPFKKYQKEFEELKAEYDMAVSKLGEKLIPFVTEKTGIEDPKFDWKIDDFASLEVEITMR